MTSDSEQPKPLDPMIQNLLGQLEEFGAPIPINNEPPIIQNLTNESPTFGSIETSVAMTVEMLESLQINYQPLPKKTGPILNENISNEKGSRYFLNVTSNYIIYINEKNCITMQKITESINFINYLKH